MPIFKCKNPNCKEKDKVVFVAVTLPVATFTNCKACMAPMVSASTTVTTNAHHTPASAKPPPTQAFKLKPLVGVIPPVKPAVSPLLQELRAKFSSRVQSATVEEIKTQIMEGHGSPTPSQFNLPVKYRFWVSDRSKQSKEVTIEIPIMVHGAATGQKYWTDKGWSAESFGRTVHPVRQPPASSGEPGVTAVNITDDAKKAWSAKINKCWGKAGVLWNGAAGQALITLKFQFRFVDDPAKAAAEVICVKTTGAASAAVPTGTIDAVRWGIDDVDPNTRGPICHEVGHLIGNPDEYFTITFEGQKKVWGPGYQNGAQFGIMNNPNNPPLVRNYRYMAQQLADKLVPPIPRSEADLLLDIAMPSTTPKRNLALALWD